MSNISYIEKLLDGVEVEWKPLEEVIHSLKTGLNPRQNFQLNTSDAQGYYVTVREIQDGKIVFLDKTDRVNDRALELINGRYKLEVGDILFSGTGTVGRTAIIEEKPANWNIKEGVYTIKPIQEKILPRFLSHLLNSSEIVKDYSKKIVGNPVVSLPMGELKKLLVPIPCPDIPEKSLAIQAEIVRILDAFTAMTAELTAELNMRKKQYNYYRDQLLSFEEGEVEWKNLEDVASFRRGSFPQPYGNSEWYDGEGCMPFVQVADVADFGFTLHQTTKQKISKLAQPKSVFVEKGTVVVSLQGTIGRVAITQYDSYVDRTLAIFTSYKEDINKKYFAHQLKAKFDLEKEFARGSTLKTITKQEFSKFQIPIPPIEEQNRIVALLDKFDTLTHSIKEGLPREIELRQKQYEYYRDLLLSFPKSHSDEAA